MSQHLLRMGLGCWEERGAGPPNLSPQISPPGTASPWAEPLSQTWGPFVPLSATSFFGPIPGCSHPAGMLWESLPGEWGADPREDPSCHPLFHCICLLQPGSAGDNGQVDTTGGFVPPASSCGQKDSQGQATATTAHPSPPPPQASLLFQPCHQLSAVILPTPSSPSSSSQTPGAARTKHNQPAYSSASGRSLPITVPTCPSLSLCPHLSPALLSQTHYLLLCVSHRVHLSCSCWSLFSLLDPHCSSTPGASPGLCEGLSTGTGAEVCPQDASVGKVCPDSSQLWVFPSCRCLPACLEAPHLWAELFVTRSLSASSCFHAQKLLEGSGGVL